MDIRLFKEKLFENSLKRGFSQCEIYYEEGNSFSVSIFEGEIDRYKNTSSKGLSFRGLYNGKMGYSYTEKISEEVIEILIENAIENAKIIETKEQEFLYDGDKEYREVNCYDESNKDVTVQDKINMALEMEKTALEYNQYVKAVENCSVAYGEGKTYISNTKGLELTEKRNYCIAYIYVRVEKENQVKTAGEVWADSNFNKFNPKEIAKLAVEKATSYLDAKQIDTRKCPVIFDNITATDLLSTFCSIFFASKVQKGFSILNGKIGEKIANDIITICDDGVYNDSLGNTAFDSEGVATKNKVVVENGILKTYLYNLKSANKDGVISTGNGFKSSFKSEVDTACTNFYIKPSNITLEEMKSKLATGILITELAGLHSGTNTISGDFSLSADGYLIENGKITGAVEQFTVSGNFYTLLENINLVGCDLKFDLPSGNGTIGSPSICVSELNISGL